jgi:hypothetical protein
MIFPPPSKINFCLSSLQTNFFPLALISMRARNTRDLNTGGANVALCSALFMEASAPTLPSASAQQSSSSPRRIVERPRRAARTNHQLAQGEHGYTPGLAASLSSSGTCWTQSNQAARPSLAQDALVSGLCQLTCCPVPSRTATTDTLVHSSGPPVPRPCPCLQNLQNLSRHPTDNRKSAALQKVRLYAGRGLKEDVGFAHFCVLPCATRSSVHLNINRENCFSTATTMPSALRRIAATLLLALEWLTSGVEKCDQNAITVIWTQHQTSALVLSRSRVFFFPLG